MFIVCVCEEGERERGREGGRDLNGRILAEVTERNVVPKQFLQKRPQLQHKTRPRREDARLERERDFGWVG